MSLNDIREIIEGGYERELKICTYVCSLISYYQSRDSTESIATMVEKWLI